MPPYPISGPSMRVLRRAARATCPHGPPGIASLLLGWADGEAGKDLIELFDGCGPDEGVLRAVLSAHLGMATEEERVALVGLAGLAVRSEPNGAMLLRVLVGTPGIALHRALLQAGWNVPAFLRRLDGTLEWETPDVDPAAAPSAYAKAVHPFEPRRTRAPDPFLARQRQAADANILKEQVMPVAVPAVVSSDGAHPWLARMADYLNERVMGQPQAVAQLVATVAAIGIGTPRRNRCAAAFVFAGPAGSGRRTAAAALGGLMGAGGDGLIHLDISVGDDGRVDHATGVEAALASEVARRPHAVLLLDGVGDSSWHIGRLLGAMLATGRLMTRQGEVVDAQGMVVVCRVQAGAPPVGMGDTGVTATRKWVDAVRLRVGAEIETRLDAIVAFRPLTTEALRGLADRQLDRAAERLGRLGMEVPDTGRTGAVRRELHAAIADGSVRGADDLGERIRTALLLDNVAFRDGMP